MTHNIRRFFPGPGLLVILLVALLGSCAVFDRRNTILINAVEEYMVPESETGQYLLAPIYIPVGLAAGVLDAFVVHPIRMIPRAIQDTDDSLWEFSEESGYVTHAGSVVYRAAFSPVFFAGAWLFRSAFITSEPDYEEEKPPGMAEGSYSDFLEARDEPSLLYSLRRCDGSSPSTGDLVRTYEIYFPSIQNQENPDYGSLPLMALRCLRSRLKDQRAHNFFENRLNTWNGPASRIVMNQAAEFFREQDSAEAARILLRAVRNPEIPWQSRHDILLQLVYISNEEAKKAVVQGLGDGR
ncbi:MAG: hypothetical protein KDK25_02120 [Leptospiraceae bacterium]|nr:hypothetical protein [Leptospiraceae bacterium]